MQRKRLVGGYYNVAPRGVMLERAIEKLQSGQIRIEPLTSATITPFSKSK